MDTIAEFVWGGAGYCIERPCMYVLYILYVRMSRDDLIFFLKYLILIIFCPCANVTSGRKAYYITTSSDSNACRSQNGGTVNGSYQKFFCTASPGGASWTSIISVGIPHCSSDHSLPVIYTLCRTVYPVVWQGYLNRSILTIRVVIGSWSPLFPVAF